MQELTENSPKLVFMTGLKDDNVILGTTEGSYAITNCVDSTLTQ